MRNCVVVSALRSPVGSFGGSFRDVSAVDLGIQVLQAGLARLQLDPGSVDEVILGNVLGSGLGQNVARQIAIGAGIPCSVPAFVVNKVCGSGMKSVALGAAAIALGDADIVIAGGVENMSRVPYAAPAARWGSRMGDQPLLDLMVRDGLWEIFHDYHMGVTAENLADRFAISRAAMDRFAARSQNRAEAAIAQGRFTDEIVPIAAPQRRGPPVQVSSDEHPRRGVTVAGLAKLEPAFRDHGRVTAGNASGINDGAAMLILMSAERARALRLDPLARLAGAASAGVEPAFMGLGPVPATAKVVARAGWAWQDIELIELNEAFAAQVLAVLEAMKAELGPVDLERLNVNGGAIALGHPIGASGARIIVTLLHEMHRRGSRKGLATLCIGGGMGMATLWERTGSA